MECSCERHCERSEAIQLDRRVASLLAMTGKMLQRT